MTAPVGRAVLLAGALAAALGCGGTEPSAPTTAPAPSADARQWMQRAVESYSAGDFDGALDSAATALTDSPASTEPYRLVSKIFSDTGRDRRGIEYFGEMTLRESERWQPWLYKGYHQFHLNRWDEALESFGRAAEIDPGNAEARSRSGMILEYQGDLDRAAEQFRAAYELEPGSPRYATRHAKSLRMGGDYSGAERVISEALAAAPESGELRYALAQIRLRQQRYGEAREALERAVELEPGHAGARKALAGILARAGREHDARRQLAIARRLNDYERHRRLLLERVGVKTGDPVLPLLLAELELTEGRFRQALQWFARAEALLGASARIRAGRAEALFGARRLDDGHSELERLPDPGGPRERLARAVGALAAGDSAGSVRLIEAAVAEAPADRNFLRRASDVYGSAGRSSEAMGLLDRAASTPRPPTP